jgi:hypothetical protein
LNVFLNIFVSKLPKEGFVAVFALLNELGGYLLPGTPQAPDLTSLVIRLLQVNGAPLFDLYLERDVTNRTRLAVFLDLPRRYGHTTRLLHRPYPEVNWHLERKVILGSRRMHVPCFSFVQQ